MNVPDTFFSLHEELVLFFLSVIFGAVIGVAYDVLRVLRLVFPHNTLLTAIEDLVFLSLCGLAFAVFSFTAARGVFRLYYLLGGVLGYTLYFFTLGSFVLGTLRKLLGLITAVLKFAAYPLKKVFAMKSKKAVVKFVGCSKNLLFLLKK